MKRTVLLLIFSLFASFSFSQTLRYKIFNFGGLEHDFIITKNGNEIKISPYGDDDYDTYNIKDVEFFEEVSASNGDYSLTIRAQKRSGDVTTYEFYDDLYCYKPNEDSEMRFVGALSDSEYKRIPLIKNLLSSPGTAKDNKKDKKQQTTTSVCKLYNVSTNKQVGTILLAYNPITRSYFATLNLNNKKYTYLITGFEETKKSNYKFNLGRSSVIELVRNTDTYKIKVLYPEYNINNTFKLQSESTKIIDHIIHDFKATPELKNMDPSFFKIKK